MKSLATAALITAISLLAVTTVASASQFPNATCPDTLSIKLLHQLLNTVGTCNPQTGAGSAPGDTINGVGGIIIGMDLIPTGFDAFLEMSGGGAYTGIDNFWDGTNFQPSYGFALGDSIVVEYGRVENFSGDIELLAPNNNFSAPNIIMRKVSSGNPLPAPFPGNTVDFNALLTNTYFAPYVGTLVKLNGPVTIQRVTGGSLAFVVDASAPSDTVYIDYFKLMGSNAPAVGTVLTSVTGVGNAGTTGWRIDPRSSADIIDAQPPTLNDCYAIADNKYRVVFDRPVTTASAQNVANYSLGSFGTVNSATIDPNSSSAVILNVTTGLNHGDNETVTASSITGVANNITMPTPQTSALFLFGVQSCGEISQPSPDSLAGSPCRDYMKYAGTGGVYSNGANGPRSTFTGIVTGVYGNLYYCEDATPTSPAGHHRGITVFAPPAPLTVGHSYIIAGNAEEYYMEGEFQGIVYIQDTGTPGVPASIPLTVAVASYDTCDAAQNINDARDYLSELVTLTDVQVVNRYLTVPTTGFSVAGDGPSFPDSMFVENQNNVLGTFATNNPNYPAVGERISVTGILHYTTNTSTPSYRVCPRTPADISPEVSASANSDWVTLFCLHCDLTGDPFWCFLCDGSWPVPGPDDATAAHVASSAWLSNVSAAALSGAPVESAIQSYMLPTASDHSWRVRFRPDSSLLVLQNTGSARDTALIRAYVDSAAVVEPLVMSAAQAVVGVPAGGTVRQAYPLAFGRVPNFTVMSATYAGRDASGVAAMAAGSTHVDDACILDCIACALFPEVEVIACIACAVCMLESDDVVDGSAARAAASSWLTRYKLDIARGDATATAIQSEIPTAATGHAWQLAFGGGVLAVHNAGSSVDTALVIAYMDASGILTALPMSAGQAIVAVPPGGTVDDSIPAATGHSPLFMAFSATGVGRNGDGIALLDMTGALGVPEGPAIADGFWLGPPMPNPSTGAVAFAFRTPARDDGSVIVFDQQGRAIRHLVSGHLVAGTTRIVWDGRDDEGRRVSPGLFFVRAKSNHFRYVQRVVLIR